MNAAVSTRLDHGPRLRNWWPVTLPDTDGSLKELVELVDGS